MTQDYKIPNEHTTGNQVVPGWFEAINQPTPLPPEQPTKRKQSKIVFVLFIAIVIIALLALLFRQYIVAGIQCIDESEYQSIIAILEPEDAALPYDQLKQDTSIYGYTVYFSEETVEFDVEQKSDVENALQRLTKATAHSPLLMISISTIHVEGADDTIAKDRLTYLRSSLIKAGVAAKFIKVSPPSVVTPAESSTPESVPVFITVTPTAICSQAN